MDFYRHLEYVTLLESIGSGVPMVRDALIEGYSGYILNESVGGTVKGLLLAAACILSACAGNHGTVRENFDDMQTYMRGIGESGINEGSVQRLAARVAKDMQSEGAESSKIIGSKAWKDAIAITQALRQSTPDDGFTGEDLASMFERSVNQRNSEFGVSPCCKAEDEQSASRRNMASNDGPVKGRFDEKTGTWEYGL
jgi:hypothetical protein